MRIVGNASNLTLVNTTVSGNTTSGASAHGGGIQFGSTETLTLVNTTVSGNAALGAGALGGGLRVTSGTANLYNSTLVGNAAASAGGSLMSGVALAPAVAESLALEQRLGAEQHGEETPLGLRWRHPEYGFYDRTASGEAICLASPEVVWQVLQQLGGEQRYFYMNELWVVREWMDHLIGGPALTRGRTNPDRFVKGDMLDSWQILGVDEGRRLDLLFNNAGVNAPTVPMGLEDPADRITVTVAGDALGDEPRRLLVSGQNMTQAAATNRSSFDEKWL